MPRFLAHEHLEGCRNSDLSPFIWVGVNQWVLHRMGLVVVLPLQQFLVIQVNVVGDAGDALEEFDVDLQPMPRLRLLVALPALACARCF